MKLIVVSYTPHLTFAVSIARLFNMIKFTGNYEKSPFHKNRAVMEEEEGGQREQHTHKKNKNTNTGERTK